MRPSTSCFLPVRPGLPQLSQNFLLSGKKRRRRHCELIKCHVVTTRKTGVVVTTFFFFLHYSSFILLHIHKTGQFDMCSMLAKQIMTFEREKKMWVWHKNRQTRNIFCMHLDKYFELSDMEIKIQTTDHLKPNSPCLIWNTYRHTSYYLGSYSVTYRIQWS